MRSIIAALVAAAMTTGAVASAQEWMEFVSATDGFRVNFPGQPRVQETTYRSEFGYMLPHVSSAPNAAASATR